MKLFMRIKSNFKKKKEFFEKNVKHLAEYSCVY